ncbi:MAG: anion transporter [Deferrisomatales bacterium]|nr:anion transporter [Deferrisomatales bacterium]
MQHTAVLVFTLVYLGMFLGRLPGLALDRAGVALLGTLVLLVSGTLTPAEVWAAADVTTLGLLFGLMVVSAQLRLGGFYSQVTHRMAEAGCGPPWVLALVVGVSGALSALLANDVVCLAMTPMLVEGCARRRLNPTPFLLGLACAANVGSAATLIGNPQNMLIGQTLDLPFLGYLRDGGVPALLGLGVVWGVVAWGYRNRWRGELPVPEVAAPADNPWQTAKGLAVLGALVVLFLATDWPREVIALGGAAVLLCSRRTASRQFLALVDWNLLVLFFGLFAVHRAVSAAGALAVAEHALRGAGVDLAHPGWLFAVTPLLSNLVSNVPATMLLLPSATTPVAGAVLALASTLAGNLLLVGSIANLIVAEQAAPLGVVLGWREHARVGIPITLLTLALAGGWLVWLYG